MGNLIKINNQDLQAKEFNSQRVVTFKDIDMLHERVEGTANKRFLDNQKHFERNVDYFEITGEDLKGIKRLPDFGIGLNASKVILISESGYLMLVKSLTDDLAWKIQRELVNNYFRVKEDNPFKHLSKEVQAIFIIDKKQQELEGEVKDIKQEIKVMRETATLTPAHCDMLNKKYRANIVKILNGKDSPAYKDNSLRSQVYSNFHKEVAKEFGVTSYKEILARDLDKFMQFISSYKPQEYLLMSIAGYNNQLKLSLQESACAKRKED